ncbi:MAG: type II toxin-antitoxin system PemK/MazF family toxin [Roseburia sp.]|nr:type II toxin-antitoxin system PemK/MazF family toxin [Roseburia sp.]
MKKYKRGDIIYVENPLKTCHGHIVAGNHPAIVVQNQVGNKFSDNLIIAYVTSKIKRVEMPTHVVLQRYSGLRKKSMVQTEQLATINKSDVISVFGHLSDTDMIKVDQALIASLGLQASF